MTDTRSANDIARLTELGGYDVLPLEIDDGTRMTCVSIAGGALSTDGVPDFLHLAITRNGESERHRYVSHLAVDHALDVDLQPGDLRELAKVLRAAIDGPGDLHAVHSSDKARVRLLLTIERLVGTADGEAPPRPTPPPEPTLIARARVALDRGIEHMLADPTRPNDVAVLAAYVAIDELRNLSTTRASSSLLHGLASGAGLALGQAFGNRQHAEPLAPSPATPPARSTRKPVKKRPGRH
jgi:hypothetical protein